MVSVRAVSSAGNPSRSTAKSSGRPRPSQVVVQWLTVNSVSGRLGVGYDTVRKRIERAKFNADHSLIPTDLSAAQRVRELERENARLRMERDILKKKATAYCGLHTQIYSLLWTTKKTALQYWQF